MPLPFMTSKELFDGIPPEDTRTIAARFVEKRYPRDAAIFHEGSEADALFIVKSGLVKLVSLSEKGTQAILHILRPGHVFGELVVAENRRPFTAVAVTDAAVAALPRKALLELLAACPAFDRNYLKLLAKRLQRVEEEFAGLLNAWAYHRLAKELLHLVSETGGDGPPWTELPLTLTHEDLSNLIGTARETVTLTLQKFEQMGMIRREGRHILVNRRRMAEYCRLEEA